MNKEQKIIAFEFRKELEQLIDSTNDINDLKRLSSILLECLEDDFIAPAHFGIYMVIKKDK